MMFNMCLYSDWGLKQKTRIPMENQGDKLEEKYVCINCCYASSSLFLKYSDNGIRLTHCVGYLLRNCGRAVDAYVEYDNVLIIIDLMLQYVKAYRHLLINSNNLVSFILMSAIFLVFVHQRRRVILGSDNIYDLEWKFYECLLQSLMEMTSLVLVQMTLLSSRYRSRLSISKALQVFCAGFYGNVFAVLSVIWHLHLIWSYRMFIELFVFISHVQALRGMFFLIAENVAVHQIIFFMLLNVYNIV
ncbi:unnamed protein product [Thelazia callipaeda]|uniref:Protein ARV n=1 Tax=Thelazia callipaeda TaxID=103827 RepID=A0A0N5CYB0_THECL|nr:unnamed protein product [Thelazia callipaeda]